MRRSAPVQLVLLFDLRLSVKANLDSFQMSTSKLAAKGIPNELHPSGSLHRGRRARQIARGADRARPRHAAGDAVGGFSLSRLPAALEPRGISQPVALHPAAAMGFHPSG